MPTYWRAVAGLLLMVLLIGPVAVADDEVRLSISLDRDKIGQEEVATLSVRVTTEGQRDVPKPNLPPLPQFDIYPIGTSTEFRSENGQVQQTYVYNYALSPKRTGTFPVRSAWLLYNNTRYESNQLSLEIVGTARDAAGDIDRTATDTEGKTRDIFLTTEIDKKTAYVDEQVTLSIKFYRSLRLLSTPGYSQPQMPDFWPTEIPPQKQYRQIINGVEYSVTELRQALFPTKPGKLRIGSAKVTATVPDRSRGGSRDPFSILDGMFEQGKEVTVKSKPLMVDVKPLPASGKTGNFSGGVGDYRISAAIDKSEVEVNEAIQLLVKISGQGNVKSIPEPTLPPLDGFRVEKSSSDFKISNIGDELGGTKTFEYLLLPRIPGAQDIPPLTLNFFDPKAERYRTVKTEPMKLTVKQGELTAGAEIPYNPVSGQTINLQETDIRYIKTDGVSLTRISRTTLTSPLFLAVLILPALVLAGGVIDVRRKHRLQGDIAYARLRRARGVAGKRLKKAAGLLSGSDAGAFYSELAGVVYQFIGDKLNQSAHGLTTETVDAMLAERDVAEATRQETLDIIRQADFGRFAGVAGGEEARRELFDRTRKLITAIEEAL